MIDIVIYRAEWPGPRQFVSPNAQLSIGRGDGCDVRLSDDSLLERHLQVLSDGVQLYLLANGPVGMSHGSSGSMALLRADDTLIVGCYQLRLQLRRAAPIGELPRYAVRDETEAGLLAAVLADQAGARTVYADWLELHGEPARAELLRVQDAIAAGHGDAAQLAGRLRAIAAEVELAWRVLVTNARVGCLALDTRCPLEWSALAPTERGDVRHCAACDQPVYYALSIGEARRHAAQQRCVAVDVLAARWDDDLAPPFDRHRCAQCHADLGPRLRRLTACPECGHKPTAGMMGRFIEPVWPAQQIRA